MDENKLLANKINSLKGSKHWIDSRLPIFSWIKVFAEHKVPANLNWLWCLGFVAIIGILLQIFTGILLAAHYIPHIDYAFTSVKLIEETINSGWLLRRLHSIGSSMIFILIYLHMLKAIYYGSFKRPGELNWLIGMFMLTMLLFISFSGYILPLSQMGYWSLVVISNLLESLPVIGESLSNFIKGGDSISDATLSRMAIMHYLFAFLLVLVIVLHIAGVLRTGSNNPGGRNLDRKNEMVGFHPKYSIMDQVALGCYFFVIVAMIFFAPYFWTHEEHLIIANDMITPENIVPEWYLLPFYSILKIIEIQSLGAVLMFASIFTLFLLPWLDYSRIRSARKRPIFKFFFMLWVIDIIILGYIGSGKIEGSLVILGKILCCYYFAYLTVILPLLSYYENQYCQDRHDF